MREAFSMLLSVQEFEVCFCMYGPIEVDGLINRGLRVIAACSASCCTRLLCEQR